MPRLKELKRWTRNGRTHVRLEFCTGQIIVDRVYQKPHAADRLVRQLRGRWWKDLISESSAKVIYKPVDNLGDAD